MAGTLNADHKGGMDCTVPQYTASQPSLPVTNFNTTGGTSQENQLSVKHDQMNIQDGQTSGQENQTASQSNETSEITNQDQVDDPKDQVADQEAPPEASHNNSATSNKSTENIDDQDRYGSLNQSNSDQLTISNKHIRDVVSTMPVEEVSSHTLSHHECSVQQCIHPGELEAEMREAILRAKRHISPAAFHAPMEMSEQNNTSHLPSELPLGHNVQPVQVSDAQKDVNHESNSQAAEVSKEEKLVWPWP